MRGMSKHIHLDTVGGISGDMFAGALLQCFPATAAELQSVLTEAGFPGLVELSCEAHNDGILTGCRFHTKAIFSQGAGKHHHHHHGSDQGHGHEHRHYADIRDRLQASSLDEDSRRHALGIFRQLAEAEAAVHGTDVDEVAFHEVGAWDSIADIVIAAWLIRRSGATSWSVSSLPRGRGLVETEHGALPVPVPAVTRLLRGYRFHEDGHEGERVTPTGAAILRYLEAGEFPARADMRLGAEGYGFGTRTFNGLSNVLRACVYEAPVGQGWHSQSLLMLAFEVDDQSPEDLALALERLRALDGVLDVSLHPVQGKKNRLSQGVRILCQPASRPSVIKLCLTETTTLGVREYPLQRHVLERMALTVEIDGHEYRVKLVSRPDGSLGMKPEIDDLAASGLDHIGREHLRRQIEDAVYDALSEQEITVGVDDEPSA